MSSKGQLKREIKKCKSEDDAAPETEKNHLSPDSGPAEKEKMVNFVQRT